MRIGIDPGLSGALARIGDGFAEVVDVPVRKRLSGKGEELDREALLVLLRAWAEGVTGVYFEQVGAMPGGGERKMGATSAFSFGRSTGQLEMAVTALGLPVVYVLPQKWKRRAGLSGKPKDTARTLAQNMWPMLHEQLRSKKNVGRADALLIAYYGAVAHE